MRLEFQERSELKLVSRINETKMLSRHRRRISQISVVSQERSDAGFGFHTRGLKVLDFLFVISKIACAKSEWSPLW